MTKRIKWNTRIIWLINLGIILTVIISTFVYVRGEAANQSKDKRGDYLHSVDSVAELATNIIDGEKRLAESWRVFVDHSNLSMQETIDLVGKQVDGKNSFAHLIWKDSLSGISTQAKATDERDYTVDYGKLAFVFQNAEEDHVQVTPRYINPMDGNNVVAFYSTVLIKNDRGARKEAYLLYLLTEEKMQDSWQFPIDYSSDVALAMINEDGSYIIKPNSMKNESFYSFIYSYNQKEIDTDRLAREICENVKGCFEGKNARKERCLWTYHQIGINSSWILVSSVPTRVFRATDIDLMLPFVIFIAMAGILFIDIMIYRYMENRTMENEKNLTIALAAAEHANRAKTTFLNNVSHDIRTPMNAIIGFTTLAAKHLSDTEKVADYLSKISTSSNHLLSLINDILDMSRIESGKVVLEEREVHLPDLFHDLRTILQADMHSKSIEFYIDALDVENEDVWCDKLRLNQVLLNLLGNAFKFTKPGGMVSLRIIQKANAPAGFAHYEFHVKDNGIGMSKEFIEHIFEPFEREENSTVSGIQGSGLGMAIANNIVTMMGGTIHIESEEGHGSEFVLDISFRIAGDVQKPTEIPALHGLNALVADDDINTCFSVCKMLEEIGMKTEWTTTGKEAVIRAQYAVEKGNEFAVYIIDWLMPDMNGIETVRRIRRVIGNECPIIILTAYDWTDIEAEAREAGVTGFCAKPLFMSELREILNFPDGYENHPAAVRDEEPYFENKRVLLVEDNISNQEIAAALLRDVGVNVDTVTDGTFAVDMIKRVSPGTYDLIFMDLQMPQMNGLDATRCIRQLEDEKKAGIPIVAMTANAFAEDVRACQEAGMDGHLGKPISRTELYGVLARFLGEGGPRQQQEIPEQDEVADPLPQGHPVSCDTLEQFYELAHGSYRDVLERMGDRKTIEQLLPIFMRDDSYHKLLSAVEQGSVKEAFEAAHSLKGVSGNYGFTELYQASSELVEQLRGLSREADRDLVEKVRKSYENVIAAWETYHRA